MYFNTIVIPFWNCQASVLANSGLFLFIDINDKKKNSNVPAVVNQSLTLKADAALAVQKHQSYFFIFYFFEEGRLWLTN